MEKYRFFFKYDIIKRRHFLGFQLPPFYNVVKRQPDKRAKVNLRGKKTNREKSQLKRESKQGKNKHGESSVAVY